MNETSKPERDVMAVGGDYPSENLPNRPSTRPRAADAAAVSEDEGGYFLDKFLGEPKGEEAAEAKAVSEAEAATIADRVVEALREIYDPEIPVNIYELGLVYGVDVDDKGQVTVTMTLTTPHCPVAESMPGEVELKVNAVEGVNGSEVKLVWDPPWDMSKMSDEARLELGML